MAAPKLLLLALLGVHLFAVPLLPRGAQAQVSQSVSHAAVNSLAGAAAAPVSVVRSPLTGLASFVSTTPGASIGVTALAHDPAETRAGVFLDVFATAFGLRDRSDVRLDRIWGPDSLGTEHVRYRQLHAGVPVTGGELSVHLDGAGVVAVNAKTLAITESINVVPTLDAAAALLVAQRLMDKHFPDSGAVVSEPQLEIFNRGLLEGRWTASHLAWFV